MCEWQYSLTDCESEFTAGSTSRTGLTIERTSHYSANNAGFTAGGDQNIFAGTDKICSEIYPIVMNSISVIKQWEENIFIFALLFIGTYIQLVLQTITYMHYVVNNAALVPT